MIHRLKELNVHKDDYEDNEISRNTISHHTHYYYLCIYTYNVYNVYVYVYINNNIKCIIIYYY